MSQNESRDEQTSIIQAAIEMVARHSKDGDVDRDEIVKVVLKIANDGDHDANTLANLAIEKMGEPSRKTA
jgi:hypothetical protein